MMKIDMDQIPFRAVRNVYHNNNVYICSGSQSPLPLLSREVPHSYRVREKHETEFQQVHFSVKHDDFITSMRYAHKPKYM